MKSSINRSVVSVVLPYLVFGGLWILLSDEVLVLLGLDHTRHTLVSIAKGWAFVLVTAVLLALVLRAELTARARNEEALRSERDFSSAVLDSLPGMVYCYDENLKFRRWNRNFTRISGYTDREVAAMSPLDFFRGAEREALAARIREVFASGYAEVEAHFVSRNGGRTCFHFTGMAVSLEGRRHLVGVGIDVSQRKRAEAELAAEARRNANLVQALGQVVYEHDVPGDKIVWSGQTEGLLGYTLEEMGHTVADWLKLVHQEDAAKLATQLEAAGGKSLFEAECRYRHKAGHYIWTFDRGIIQRDSEGRVRSICGILWDIGELKQAEAALSESEERLRLALEAAHMGTFDWDLITGRIVWSRWHAELWGFRPGEFPGTYEAFSSRLHPADLPGINAELARCMTSRVPFKQEFRVVWPDQSTLWVLATGEFTFDAAGRPVRMRGTVKEITERKQAEDELRQSREQLRALTGRLETLREEERTRISREIHDELGQMLTALKMDLRWIEHGLDEFGTDRRLNPVLDKLTETGELVDATLKTVQRIAAELRPGILDKLGLGNALEYEAARFQERSGVSCHVSLPANEPCLNPAVATAFFRIFQEALTNVSRHARATAVEVELKCGQTGCQLVISDNGRGLSGADWFNPKSLGLLGMRERARLLGGDLTFTARAGGGTVVAVHIPTVASGGSET